MGWPPAASFNRRFFPDKDRQTDKAFNCRENKTRDGHVESQDDMLVSSWISTLIFLLFCGSNCTCQCCFHMQRKKVFAFYIHNQENRKQKVSVWFISGQKYLSSLRMGRRFEGLNESCFRITFLLGIKNINSQVILPVATNSKSQTKHLTSLCQEIGQRKRERLRAIKWTRIACIFVLFKQNLSVLLLGFLVSFDRKWTSIGTKLRA